MLPPIYLQPYFTAPDRKTACWGSWKGLGL